MRSKDLIANAKKANAATLAAAFQTGDETKMTEALATFCGDIEEAVLQQAQQEADERNQDTAIMAARGVHVLTSAEMNYYTELGKCVKSGDPKMAITNFKVAMPETVIDGVIGTIKKEHPLLDRISFVNTSYLTRFVVNAAPASAATWGNITDKISKELTGALKDFNMTLLKLSVFMCISQDLVDLGPQYLDQYVRESLSESIAMALESAIVDGDGNGKPIGMTRDISDTASVVGGAYPRMTAVKLDKLDPAPLGNIVAKLARDPVDATKARAIDPGDLIFLCNPFDYCRRLCPPLPSAAPTAPGRTTFCPFPQRPCRPPPWKAARPCWALRPATSRAWAQPARTAPSCRTTACAFSRTSAPTKPSCRVTPAPWTLTPSSCWTFPPLTPTPPRWCRLSPLS